MGRPVVHFEVLGKDAGRLHAFYGELFDWKITPAGDGPYGIVNAEDNGGGISGGVGQVPEGMGDGHVTFYVGVEDVEAALAEAERLGGTRMMGPEKVMEGVVIGLFQDPEGNLVGVANDR